MNCRKIVEEGDGQLVAKRKGARESKGFGLVKKTELLPQKEKRSPALDYVGLRSGRGETLDRLDVLNKRTRRLSRVEEGGGDRDNCGIPSSKKID